VNGVLTFGDGTRWVCAPSAETSPQSLEDVVVNMVPSVWLDGDAHAALIAELEERRVMVLTQRRFLAKDDPHLTDDEPATDEGPQDDGPKNDPVPTEEEPT
jgi:hypothetical protein